MIKQDWMVIVAGEKLVDEMTAEIKACCEHTGYGYKSDQLCKLQQEQARRGILGVEIVKSNYGYSVRYDSGLQNFGLLASSKARQIDGTLEAAVNWVKNWVNQSPNQRYAWYRK